MNEKCLVTNGQLNLFGELQWKKFYHHKWKDAVRQNEQSARSKCVRCKYISLLMWDYLHIKPENRSIIIDVKRWTRILSYEYGEDIVRWAIKY